MFSVTWVTLTKLNLVDYARMKKCFCLAENHITVGELLEQKSSTEVDNANTPHMANGDASWNPDSESSQATGGFTVAFSLSVVQVVFIISYMLF